MKLTDAQIQFAKRLQMCRIKIVLRETSRVQFGYSVHLWTSKNADVLETSSNT